MNEVKPGAWIEEISANPAVADIQGNKTLIIETLTDEPPSEGPEIRKLSSLKDVFESYKPSKKVAFESPEGSDINEELQFRSLSDFGKQGIVKQSPFLNDLNQECDDLQKIVRQLKSNKTFQKLLEDKDARASYLAAIQTMITELDEADK